MPTRNHLTGYQMLLNPKSDETIQLYLCVLCDSFYVIFRCMKSIEKKVKGNAYKQTRKQIPSKQIVVRHFFYNSYVCKCARDGTF